MDKIVLKFLADVLYIKELLTIEEYEAIMDCKDVSDLDIVVDKMLRDEFQIILQGENYG